MTAEEHRQAPRFKFEALYKTFPFWYLTALALPLTNPWLFFICSIEIFFLDIAAGLASLGTSHVTDAKQLPRTKKPDGPKQDEVTCSQTCLKQVYRYCQHIYCIQGHCVAGLQPPGIA